MEPKRLDQIMVMRHPYYSRTQIKKLIEDGFVKINGEIKTKASFIIKGGEEIELLRRAPEIPKATPEDIPLTILFEDESLIVINKAPGMVVHPAPGHFNGTLVHALLHHLGQPLPEAVSLPLEEDAIEVETEDEIIEEESGFKDVEFFRPGIVHRLDKGTSGVMVVSKNDSSLAALAKQFKDHTVEKVYETFAFGKFPLKNGTIISSIGRDMIHRRKFSTKTKFGREAITHYEMVEQYEGVMYLRIKIETGRTHQIRVHLSEKGHPILGDAMYGAKSFVSMIKKPEAVLVVEALGRPLLHARNLSFTHPVTKERMNFEAELPDDFKQMKSLLG